MLNSLCSLRFWSGHLLLAALVLSCVGSRSAFAQAGNTVPGAIWNVTLTPKVASLGKLNGRYRLHNHVIYTKADGTDTKFSKVAGKNIPISGPPGHRTTTTIFKELIVRDESGNVSTMKGTAKLRPVGKPGEASGLFVDGDGNRWDMYVMRIKE